MTLTREQIENYLARARNNEEGFISPDRVSTIALCDLALAAKGMEEELKIAHRIALEGNPVFQSLRLERDAMREAIKRAVADLEQYYDHQAGKNYYQIRADLSNAIKEGK